MKRILFALVLFVTAAPFLNAQQWVIDGSHSSVEFAVDHMVISETTGKFSKFDGTFTSAGTDFADLKGEVSIDAASINTENADRDKHLRGADFFDVEKFPKLTFKVTSVKRSGNKATAEGTLTMHGVTKPVKLDGTFKGTAKDPWGNTRAGFQFTAALNRKDYGLTWNNKLETGGLVVGEEVRITIRTEIIKK